MPESKPHSDWEIVNRWLRTTLVSPDDTVTQDALAALARIEEQLEALRKWAEVAYTELAECYDPSGQFPIHATLRDSYPASEPKEGA